MTAQLLMVDSHCHLNCLPDGDNPARVASYLEEAREAGVGHFLCVSIDYETFPEVLTLAKQFAPVFASVGVHPNHREGHEPSVEELVQLAQAPEIVAIGETGLDYFRSEDESDWQQARFRRHIAAARQTGKPLIIHTRQARADTLRIMAEEAAAEVGGVMHCFTEDWDMARAAMDMDFYISFSGIVTFNSANSLREVARKMPLERMLIETDAPYLAPVPHRGKPNQPAYVRHVAQCIAEVRGEPLARIVEQTTANFFKLFSQAVPAC